MMEYKPLWIEEPTSPDDILGHAKISRVPFLRLSSTLSTICFLNHCVDLVLESVVNFSLYDNSESTAISLLSCVNLPVKMMFQKLNVKVYFCIECYGGFSSLRNTIFLKK